MNNFSIFGSLLAADVNNGSFKSVKFSDASALDSSVSNLSSITKEADEFEATPENVKSAVESYGELYNDRLNNGVYLDTYDKIADQFAVILSKGIENLKALKKDVATIEDQINKGTSQLISEDPMLAAYDKKHANPEQLSMEGIDWSILDKVCERAVIERLHDSINQEVTSPITNATIGLILNKLPNTNHLNGVEFNSIPLTKENRTRITSAIYAEVKENFTESEVQSLVDFVFDFNTNQSRVANRALDDFKNGKNSDQINKFLKIVDSYSQILPYFTKEIVDLSNSTQAELDKHVVCMNRVLDATAYICINYRRNLWKDAILVPGGYINTDNFNSFKEDGGKISDVVQYNKRYFSDTLIPNTGISAKTINETMDNIRATIDKEVADQSYQCETKKKAIQREVFTANAYKWLIGHKDQFSPKFSGAASLDKFVNSVYDSARPTDSVEDLLYTAMLNSCYINSIERNIYNRLRTAYAKHANASNKLTKEDCELIDISVYSDMICEYLVDKGIVVA